MTRMFLMHDGLALYWVEVEVIRVAFCELRCIAWCSERVHIETLVETCFFGLKWRDIRRSKTTGSFLWGRRIHFRLLLAYLMELQRKWR